MKETNKDWLKKVADEKPLTENPKLKTLSNVLDNFNQCYKDEQQLKKELAEFLKHQK